MMGITSERSSFALVITVSLLRLCSIRHTSKMKICATALRRYLDLRASHADCAYGAEWMISDLKI